MKTKLRGKRKNVLGMGCVLCFLYSQSPLFYITKYVRTELENLHPWERQREEHSHKLTNFVPAIINITIVGTKKEAANSSWELEVVRWKK